MIRKDLIIAILATFCLTATLFLIIPIRSQTTGQYDPSLDVNHDCKIDGKDIALPASIFGTAGDPTAPVNVTTIPSASIQTDLNISLPGPMAVTNIFTTAGYDRIFVSAAITDISDYSQNFTSVVLSGAYWYWGIVNGTSMKTYDPVDSNRQLRINMWNPSYIPVPSEDYSEFAVKATQCSLLFNASSWFSKGWILIRVSIYLTIGTTSPTDVQNTYVTNMPSIQPQPSYENYGNVINASITNGYGGGSLLTSIGGYSRIFMSIEIISASYQGVPVSTTVSLSGIYWSFPSGFETVSPNVLNATYDGTYLPVYSQQIPPEFETRISSCYLQFSISSGAFSGWVEFQVSVYLRNE